MALRDKLKKAAGTLSYQDLANQRFSTYGIIDNPFPSAAQTQDHPHLETEADDKIFECIRVYDESQSTQVLVIEGDQGTGKTNLLNYYDREFKDLYQDTDGFYIIRYYADPEPGFDKMLARIFQELGSNFIKKMAKAMAQSNNGANIIATAKSSDMRTVLHSLRKAAKEPDETLNEVANAALEWMLGSRLLKRHQKLGQIHFRLDTIESRTQVLRDLVFCSADLNILKGLILLLDELEKQDATTSKMMVLRFLSAIRALIDALPKYLFLMTAITPEARRRYFEMLPAFAGRLQNRIELPYLKNKDKATELYQFYLKEAQEKATSKQGKKVSSNVKAVISEDEVIDIFDKLLKVAQSQGDEGVRHRDFLNNLHKLTEERFSKLQKE